MSKRLDPWLGVELRHLSTFHAVAQEESFSRAAERLGYTQSAVSHQIAALERIVGVRLINRPGGRRPVSLTEHGALLFRHVQSMLVTLSLAEAEMRSLLEGERRLRVGIFQSVGVKLMPAIMKYFSASFPHTAIELEEQGSDIDLLRSVEDGGIDLSFATLPLEGPFAFEELLSDPYMLLVPARSKLAARRSPLALHDLAEIPLMSFRSCRRAAQLREDLRSRGVEPQFLYPSEDNNTVQALVAAGIGAAVFPRLAIETAYLGSTVVEMPLAIPSRVIALAWHQDRSLNRAAKHFIAVARRVCAAMADDSEQALAAQA